MAAGDARDVPAAARPGELQCTLRSLLASDWARSDPKLGIETVGEICRNGGTLSWETCLLLANSRTGFHHFVEGGPGDRWQVAADVRVGQQGDLEVPFSVLHQPLSPRFRGYYDSLALLGRIRILQTLVAYAARLHTSVVRIGMAEAQHQVTLREAELWEEFLSLDAEHSFEGGV
jgi:hypothetical protein